MKVTDYHGPARDFAEGSPEFDLMVKRAEDFMSYLIFWGGGGDKPYVAQGQQERLGFGRAMAIALEKNPSILSENRQMLIDAITSRTPPYSSMERLEKLGMGRYTGGMVDQWRWNRSSAAFTEANISIEDLNQLYISLRH